MKKLLSTALLLSVLSTSAMAMDFNSLDYNVKGGVNYTTLSDITDAESKLGFTVGAGTELALDNKLSISADALFATKGAKAKANNVETESNLTYVDFPVNVNYELAQDFTVFGGGYFSYLLDAKTKSGSTETDAKDKLEAMMLVSSLVHSMTMSNLQFQVSIH